MDAVSTPQTLTHAVLRLAKRPATLPLETWQAAALEQARSAPAPAGCTQRAHSRVGARAYRQGEPVIDTYDEWVFAEATAAHAWCAQLAAQPHDGVQACVVTQCITISDGPVPADAPKHMELVRRRPDLDPAAFLTYWQDVHGPIAAAIPGVVRYHQLPVLEHQGDPAAPVFDGFALLRFASFDALRASAGTPAFAATRADIGNFMDTASAVSLLTEEVWSAACG